MENIMKPSEWELDSLKTVDANDIPWDEGMQAIKILDVVYHDAFTSEKFPNTYTITAEPVDNDSGAVGRFMFWLKRRETGEDNRVAIGILNRLWSAIYGKTDKLGIPKPSDAEGCVVMADIGYFNDYLQISNFKPAPESYALYSDKMNSQYFAPVEE